MRGFAGKVTQAGVVVGVMTGKPVRVRAVAPTPAMLDSWGWVSWHGFREEEAAAVDIPVQVNKAPESAWAGVGAGADLAAQ
eukprot:gene13331-15307_t